MTQENEIRQVKNQHAESLLARQNVVGVGIGYKEVGGEPTGSLSLKVLVRQKLPVSGLDPKAVVPSRLNGVETDVVPVGLIRALQARTGRWRPAPGGVSLGHYQITAGTFGCVVRDRSSGVRLILSNNHVLANSNAAQVGDPILQPGPADGGRQDQDIIARLERFCPIEFSVAPPTCNLAIGFATIGNILARMLGSRHRLNVYQKNQAATNLVDAAVARPLDDTLIKDDILEIGIVTGTVEAALGMTVRKSGRTTGFTTGVITVLDATVDVSYGAGRTARFEDQIVCGPMSQGGDSGSLLVAGDSLAAVGLLFAGSEGSTVFNPIQAVLDCLEVTI